MIDDTVGQALGRKRAIVSYCSPAVCSRKVARSLLGIAMTAVIVRPHNCMCRTMTAVIRPHNCMWSDDDCSHPTS